MRGISERHQLTSAPGIRTKPDQRSVDRIVIEHIRSHAEKKGKIEILEAGCGRRWPYDLSCLRYNLTGVDINADALRIRQHVERDLDRIVLGDLRAVKFERHRFDIIYSAFVLEHVSQTRLILSNFLLWLKPDGLLILKFPDRDSVYGFVARMTPFWFHLLYKKYLLGKRDAGKPGFGPFPTVYEDVIARKTFHKFIEESSLIMREEYGFGALSGVQELFAKLCSWLSFGHLTAEYYNLLYILERQPGPAAALSEAPACRYSGARPDSWTASQAVGSEVVCPRCSA